MNGTRLLLWPAVTLMNRLSFAQKFIVTGFLILTPVAVITSLVGHVAGDQLRFNKKEYSGVQYLTAALPMLEELQRTRIVVSASRSDDAKRAELVEQTRTIDALLPAIDAVDSQYQEAFRTFDGHYPVSEGWAEIKAGWLASRPHLFGSPQLASVTLERLCRRVMSWIQSDLANQSHLALDPDLDSYWLMDAYVSRLPSLLDGLTSIGTLLAQISDPKGFKPSAYGLSSTHRPLELAVAHANSERLTNEILTISFASAFAANSIHGGRMRERMWPVVTAMVDKSNRLLANLQNNFLSEDDVAVQSDDPLLDADAAIKAASQLLLTVGPELAHLIQIRIEGHQRELLLGRCSGAFAAFVLVYVFVALSSSVSTSVGSLGDFTQRMIDGTEERFELLTKDDFGKIATLYNAVNAALVEARANKAELERRAGDLLALNSCLALEYERGELATQKLDFERRQSQMLLTSLSAVMIAVDRSGRIVHWNREAERAFGTAAEAIVGTELEATSIPWQGDSIQTAMQARGDAVESTVIAGVPFVRADGQSGFLNVTVSPVLDEKNQPGGWLLLATDVTAETNLQAQLQQAQKLESIGQLAAGIAHEINTPIQFVGDNTRFLERSVKSLHALLGDYGRLVRAVEGNTVTPELTQQVVAAERAADLEFLLAEMPGGCPGSC